MFDYTLVKCIDPSQFRMRLDPKEFKDTYAPAYGDTWEEATNLIHSRPADVTIFYALHEEYMRDGKFREVPKVVLPQSDIDDREEYEAAVANGMHRTLVHCHTETPVEFAFYYPDLPTDEEWTEVDLIFVERVSEDDDMFGWLRSMRLDNGQWVEAYMGSQDGRRYSLYLDKVSDHKLLLKRLHEFAALDEFVKYGLIEIHIHDETDEDHD